MRTHVNYGRFYRHLHQIEANWFKGYSVVPYARQIAELVFEHQPDRMLDYGSGKGYQYLGRRIQQHWGGLLPHCYDPGVKALKERPEGVFGGIICTDVMEHIAENDVDSVLADIFGFAADHAFVFFVIACRPALKKKLPDGRNVHLTVRPPEWWEERLRGYARPGLTIVAEYDTENLANADAAADDD